MDDFLKNLKVGDKVIVSCVGDLGNVHVIEGETKKAWRVNGSLYSKTSGWLRGGDGWFIYTIREATPKAVEELNTRKKILDINKKFESLLHRMNEGQLNRVIDVMNEVEQGV